MSTTAHHCACEAKEVALGGYSPVSYFQKGRAELGSPEHAVEHDCKVYHLASAEQAQAFRKNPEKYVPAHGGACAYGALKGKTFPVDPTSFEVVDGQLLLFLKTDEVDARQLWEQEYGKGCATGSCSC